jgi:integrase
VLRGEAIRKSLDLTNWEAANRLIMEWEVSGPDKNVSVNDACERFVADVESRGIGPAQTAKYKLLTRELIAEFGTLPVKAISVDDLRKFREGWKLSAISASKKLERLRSFFSFCESSGWVEKNPARGVKSPQAKQLPTLPFSDGEWKDILTALDVYGEIHVQSPSTIQRQLRALILLMRYSGLRISDAVSLKRDRIDDEGRLFIYQAKTGHPVSLPIPRCVREALASLDKDQESFFFWSGQGKLKSSITQWQERLKKVFVIAGIPQGHGHMLRDSFAVDLLTKGVPLEVVSTLLGHTSIKTTEKHYAPWVKSRQLALDSAVRSSWTFATQ